ncbi:MAG: hypothetical protein HY694_01885 [Deltaproteobacteria bacterium]|nr:hypothetical protein [Deltaproteobacteria bacterium]
MRKRKRLMLITVALMVVIGSATYWSVAHAQVTTVDFVVPTGTALVAGVGNDKIVFTGRSSGTTGVGNCGTGDRPVQNAVMVDPAGGRATRLSGIIGVSGAADPVQNGTRLKNLVGLGACGTSNEYDKYRGEVD